MSWVFYLSDVFKFVINRSDQSSFAKHDLVGDRHQRVPHVVLDFCDNLNTVHEQELKQLLADRSFISTEFAPDVFNKWLWIQRLTVIDIARSEYKVKNSTFVIDDQMQLKAEEPSHRALAPPGYTFECLVDKDALMFADSQRRWIIVELSNSYIELTFYY